jgi:flagellar hook-associated protein 3 FlgL
MIDALSARDQRFLASMDQIDRRLTQAQREVTSGRRVNVASDHPDDLGALLSTKAGLDQTNQIVLNLVRASSEVDTGEQAISNAVTLLDQATGLAAQAATETMPAQQRKTIGDQIDAMLQQLVSTAGTQVQGRYIFSGDNDQVPPYSLDAAVPPATLATVSTYGGSDSTRQLMHPNGTTFSVGLTAQQIFDSPGASVFTALTDLRDALTNNPNDPSSTTDYHSQTTLINTAQAELDAAKNHINESLTFYGVTQNRITDANTFAGQLKLQQQQQLSSVQDADITESIVELNQEITQRQAALEARAKIPNTSLFDYLK